MTQRADPVGEAFRGELLPTNRARNQASESSLKVLHPNEPAPGAGSGLRERARSGLLLSFLRFAGTTLFLLLTVVLGVLFDLPNWRPDFRLFGAYWVAPAIVLTKPHDVAILVSEVTRAQIADTRHFSATQPTPIRGRSEPLQTYVVAAHAVEGGAECTEVRAQ